MMFVIQKTRIGHIIRAGESNREMVEALGIDARLLFRFVFAAGVALAATAGIVASPLESVYPGIGEPVLIISFVVVVIGGIGSSRALYRRDPDRCRRRLGKVYLPQFASIVYALMAAVLIARPGGLFGRTDARPPPACHSAAPLVLSRSRCRSSAAHSR